MKLMSQRATTLDPGRRVSARTSERRHNVGAAVLGQDSKTAADITGMTIPLGKDRSSQADRI